MKVLFVLRTDGFLRNFEGAIREMRRRGHYVTVAVELDIRKRGNPLVAELRDEGVAFKRAPSRLYNARHQTAVQARLGLDYLRYLDDRYADKDKLRERAAAAAPALVRLLANAPGGRTSRGRERIGHGLAAFDAASPVSPEVQSFLRRQPARRPAHLAAGRARCSPTDWIRAARELGVPSVLGVASWDNLTVKGKLREWPDRVLVWNDAQVGEASEIHGLPADRVIATGAHSYDHWFRWRPSRDREQFCAEAGLRGDRPILLYLCSSPFIAPGEAQFVLDWIAALRDSREPELREAGVLVRPHPQHAAQLGGRQPRRARQRGPVPTGGSRSRRTVVAQRLLRFHLPLPRGRRRQYQRADRGVRGRSRCADGARPAVRLHAGRDASLRAHRARRRRAACASAATWPSITSNWLPACAVRTTAQ